MAKKILLLIIVFSLTGCLDKSSIKMETNVFPFLTIPNLPKRTYSIDIIEEEIFYAPLKKGYLYGPSILKNGEYEIWFSSPGNNSTEWDYIAYYHGYLNNWSNKQIVLKPTKNSADRCSVCDPAIIFFNDYYYLAYTSTDNYGQNGMDNSAFVARAKSPDGPYEKWNGNGWGGNPEPIIEYTKEQTSWGIGEISFVVLNDKLYIYYTNISEDGMFTDLAIADISDNWPSTINLIGHVNERGISDSLDVAYDDKTEQFIGISIKRRMDTNAELTLFISEDGTEFEEEASVRIDDYSHNAGIEKDLLGHINTENELLIGYAYGSEWGKWNTKLAVVKISEK